jgi:hypothetical protein
VHPPFSVEQFLEVFANYNAAIWPAQILACSLGIFAVLLAFARWKPSGKLIAGVLTLFWLWTGLVYHILFFSAINRPAYIFGLLFIVQGALFLYFGVIKNDLTFRFALNVHGIVGAVFIFYAMLIYPLLGHILGHGYPQSPVFGIAPCPLVIFTFGILLLARQGVPLILLGIPFLWSLIGSSAVIYLGMREDVGLLAASVIGTTIILWQNSHRARAERLRV